MGDKSGFMGLLGGGELSPFTRLVVILALGSGLGLNIRTLIDPPDTSDRWRGTQAREKWRKHEAEEAAEKIEILGRISNLETHFQEHLEHSARYTQIIDRLVADEEETRDTLNKHLRKEH